MSFSTDKYFGRKYNIHSYGCASFAVDVWLDLTGQDLSNELSLSTKTNKVTTSNLRRFKRLETPSDPCLVFFQYHKATPHVGVFVRGKVLHITEKGVQYQPIEVVGVGAKRVRYYLC